MGCGWREENKKNKKPEASRSAPGRASIKALDVDHWELLEIAGALAERVHS